MSEPCKISDAQQRFNYVYSTLRKRICLLEYEPGQRLSEEALAKEFNFSRTPIRRVLAALENAGMVEIRHGAGNYVSLIELDYLCDIYAMRMELVMLITGKLKSPIPANVLPDFRALLAKGQDLAKTVPTSTVFAEINLQMFELTMQMVDSRALVELLSSLFYKSSRMWPYLVNNEQLLHKELRVMNEEITDLIRVIEGEAYNSVATIIRYHIETAMQRLRKYSQQQPQC